MESRILLGARDGDGRGEGLDCGGHEGTFGGVRSVLYLEGRGYMGVHNCQNSLNSTFHKVDFF